MNIQFFEPLGRAWDRMVTILFRPFDIGKWFSLGFTAFLAGLMNRGGSAGSSSRNMDSWHEVEDGFFHFPEKAWDWFLTHPAWAVLIVMGIFLLIALCVLFTWLSSRGKFAFLDNVVHNRSEVVKPWKEFRRQADSLFLWRLVYGMLVFLVFSGFMVAAFLSFRQLYLSDALREFWFSRAAGLGILFLFLIVLVGYINLFLEHFVVPLMYKYRRGVLEGWRMFLNLFSSQLGWFLVYGIIVFLLVILTVIMVLVFGLVTCCIGFLFLVIPYLSSVVLLPVSVTFRSYGLEFLKQFGEDYDVFPSDALSPDGEA